MAVVLNSADSVFIEVPLKSGSFDLELKYPTYSELIDDLKNTDGALAEQRIRRTVVGWRGVMDTHGQPVVFSWDSLQTLLGRHPYCLGVIVDAISQIYLGGDGIDAKN